MSLLPLSPSKSRGFTYAEFLVAGAIAVIIATAGLYVYISGERATAASSAKLAATAEARRAMDWIVRDVREAVSWEMASAGNSPSDSHIKFRKVEGWDMANNTTFLLTANYTEYSYLAADDMLVRNLLDLSNNTLQTHSFRNITQEPFYAYNVSGDVVALNSGDLLTTPKVIVRIMSESFYKPSLSVNTTLESEVRLRNE